MKHEASPHKEAILTRYQRYERRSRKPNQSQLNVRIDNDLKLRVIQQAATEGIDLSAFVSASLEMRLAADLSASLPARARSDDETRLDMIRVRDEYVACTGKPWTQRDDQHYARIATLPRVIRFAGFYNALLRRKANTIGSFAYVVTVIKQTQKEHANGEYPDIEHYAQDAEQLVKNKYGKAASNLAHTLLAVSTYLTATASCIIL